MCGSEVLLITAAKKNKVAWLLNKRLVKIVFLKERKSAASILGMCFELSAMLVLDLIIVLFMERFAITEKAMWQRHKNL